MNAVASVRQECPGMVTFKEKIMGPSHSLGRGLVEWYGEDAHSMETVGDEVVQGVGDAKPGVDLQLERRYDPEVDQRIRCGDVTLII